MRARALILVVLLLSYGAVGARQPAVRASVPLPAPLATIAEALDLPSIDRGEFALKSVRTLYSTLQPDGDPVLRSKLREMLVAPVVTPGELAPLPLDAAIWRETILKRPVPDAQILAAILSDRSAALLYHGLAGLDDDTLAWLGAERDLLQHLVRHAGAFSIFGPSVRIRAGRVIVPGGADAEAVWQSVVGADPARPVSFVKKLFSDDSGDLAWFYDSVAQLDEAGVRFALNMAAPPGARADRTRALLEIFERTSNDWRPELQPFSRRSLDPSLTLSVVAVTPEGTLVGPRARAFWEHVFDEGAGPVAAKDVLSGDSGTVDAAWLLSRIHRAPVDQGRRRFETFLYSQRLFPDLAQPDAHAAAVLRAYAAFPALMLTLERSGVRSIAALSAAAARAHALNEIGSDARRRAAIIEFQSLLVIIDRMTRAGSLTPGTSEALVTSLAALETSSRGYDGKLGAWIAAELAPALRAVPPETSDALESTILAAMAGVDPGAPVRTIEWEGRQYQVAAERAEAIRLHKIRDRQGGPSLSAAIAEAHKAQGEKNLERADTVLADTLMSIAYAAYLGDPDGPAVRTDNIALRHELGAFGVDVSRSAWRLATEANAGKGWHLAGSLLALDVGLARMSLRRLDSNVMPPEPRIVSAERQTAALTVALLNAATLRDAARDEIASALGRGRARLAALDGSRAEIEKIAADAGLSAWRREALAWTAANDRNNLSSQLSLVEIMLLGKPRASPALALDGWGAAVLPLNGCLCLAMPHARPWEMLSGRPSLGLLATRGADVSILIADALASLKLPSQLAPGVIAYAMQEVLDQARPAFFDDWPEFSRAAIAVKRDMVVDYIAAQTAGGALLPARMADDRQH
ncbi:MAG TPA: hypothetical protein VFJ02_11155 [Vicinamibacterales bacterium]|nr:hypothetical protein [Vicinamibacterales bacterium]